jgi:hypothetical protein
MATLSPPPKLQFFDASGVPLVGGKLYSYAAGTTTPLVTYTSESGTVPNTNPVILDSRGEASVWLGSAAYKLKLTTSTDVEIWTVDNIDNITQADLDALEASIKAYYAASSGATRVGYIQDIVNATARTVESKASDIISLKDFGAVGDGTTDDTTAVNNWITAVIASDGGAGYVPTGIYRVTSQITIDVTNCRATGIRLWGDGPRRSYFNSAYTAGTCFRLINTNASEGYFYTSMDGIGFEGNVNGTLFELGDPAGGDAGNSLNFRNITMNNVSNGVNAKVLVMTRIFASTFENLTVNGFGGAASNSIVVTLNEVQFSNFNSCAFGNGKTLLVFGTGASGYSFGNTFTNQDLEEGTLCLLIDSAFATKNTFLGGTFVSTFGDYCVDANLGDSNMFINVNYAAFNISEFDTKVGVIDMRHNLMRYSSDYNFFIANINQFSAGNTGSTIPNIQFNSSLGTDATPTVLTAAQQVGSLYGRAYDGSAYRTTSRIDLYSSGAPVTSTSSPGTIRFSTTPSASVTPVIRSLVLETGNFVPETDNAYSLGQSGQRWSAVWAANGTIQTSDWRDKTNIQPATLGLGFINALKPVSFNWKTGRKEIVRQDYVDADGNVVHPDDPNFADAVPGPIITQDVPGSRTHWGLIAQEVHAACGAAGVDFGGWVLSDTTDPDSPQALRYDQFIAPLIKAVQELSARVEALEAKG